MGRGRRCTILAFSLLYVLGIFPIAAGAASSAAGSRTQLHNSARHTAALSAAERGQLVAAYGRLPLAFEANHGQSAAQVRFLARGQGYTIFLTPSGAVLSLSGGAPQLFSEARAKTATPTQTVVRMRLLGASADASFSGLNELSGKANYFIGNDPSKWRTNIPLFGQVQVAGVYPGINLLYHGNGGQLEYDFALAPGADPNAIRLGLDAPNSKVEIAKNGDLVLQTPGGEVRFRKPVVFQPVAPVYDRRTALAEARNSAANRQDSIPHRQSIDGRFVLLADNEVGFEVANYDRSRPLVIDPTLVYSTLLGSTSTTNSNVSQAAGIAIDSSGNAYITGSTRAADFPTTVGSLQATFNSGSCPSQSGTRPCRQAFVTKLNPTGTALVYSTYLGGSNENNQAQGIAIDSAGEAYVTGITQASNFPVTSSTAYQASLSAGQCNISNGLEPCPDAFFTKLNASGSALVYSTYLGGPGPTNGTGITGANAGLGVAVDSTGNAYLMGITASSAFPTTAGAYQTTFPSGSNTCTFNGVSGNCPSAFVAKINPSLSGAASLLYSTYLGGTASGFVGLDPFSLSGNGGPAGGIAVDSSDNAYVIGYADTATFPDGSGNFGSGSAPGGSCTLNGLTAPCGEAFVAKLNPAASGSASLVYSGFVGAANGNTDGLGIAVDSSGNAYVTGYTTSTNFPTTTGAFQTTFVGRTYDGFVAKINSAGTAFDYSSLLGGDEFSDTDILGSGGITVDSSGDAIVTGDTNSPDIFPTVNAIQSANNGGDTCTNSNGALRVCANAFVTEFKPDGSRLLFSTYLGGTGDAGGAGIAVDSSGNIYVTGTTQPGFPTTPGAFQTSSTANAAFVAKISLTTTAAVNASPATLTFSSQTVGTTSAAQTVTLTNNTTSSVNLTAISITGTDSADFTAPASGSSCTSTSSLAAGGGSCTINVTFNPNATGSLSATLDVSTNSTITPSLSVSLSGAGVSAGNISLSPTALSFGNQNVGATSAPQTVTLTNTGTGTLGSIAASTSLSVFVLSSTTCGPTLAAGASCTESVTFAPAGNGTVAGALTVTGDSANSPQTVTLTGTGTSPIFSPSPASLGFGNQEVGTTSATSTLTVTNTGNIALSISSVALGGANAAEFAIASNTCASVAPSATCAVGVAFAPTAAGAAGASLTFTDNNNNVVGSTQTISLSGTGTAPIVSLSASSLTFGATVIGAASPAQTVTVSNTGTAPLNISGFVASGAFAVATSGTTCSTSSAVAAGASCAIAVTFTPTAAGTLSGSLTITDNNNAVAGSTQTVSLTGAGTTIAVKVSPSTLSFGGQVVGAVSAPQTVTVYDTGTTPVTFSSISASPNFAVASGANACSTSAPLAGGSSCLIYVTFTPAAAGNVSGMLTLVDNDPSSPQNIPLSGAGQDFSVAAFTTSQTVLPGAGTSYLLNVSPEGGFSGAVALACSGAPTNSTCAVTPSSVTLTGVGYAAPSVQVTTTAPSALPPRAPEPPGLPPVWVGLALLSLVGLSLLARLRSPIPDPHRGAESRPAAGGRPGRLAWLALATTLLGLALWASCGRGAAPALHVPSGGTQAGAYTLTVTGTSGNLTHSISLTLNVQ